MSLDFLNVNACVVPDSAMLGEHELTGVDFGAESIEDYYHTTDANVMYFVLDGTVYKTMENPDDGYRSLLGVFEASDYRVQNTFPACRVIGAENADKDRTTIVFTDAVTGKVVLELGTDFGDSYYPCYIAAFTPENMACNQISNSSK
ncbi:MAG: hypothetical protein WC505_07630 [Patescibacteria group bacterium]